MAAELLATAVRLVEPALPPLLWNPTVPLEPGEPGYNAVRYLAERDLLPADWSPGELDPATWQEMLDSFLAWYALPSIPATVPVTSESMTGDVARSLEEVSASVRPLLLVATDDEDSSRPAFVGLVWNWTVYPRLIVYRPQPDWSVRGGVRSLLDEFSNCAVSVDHYVLAPERTARNLFLSHAEARMFVIGSEPQRGAWPLLVPAGEEESYFAFAADEVADLVSFAAAFDGTQLGVMSLMSMLPRLRTNLPPTRLPGILQTPLVR